MTIRRKLKEELRVAPQIPFVRRLTIKCFGTDIRRQDANLGRRRCTLSRDMGLGPEFPLDLGPMHDPA
jgi:hypothetical protein